MRISVVVGCLVVVFAVVDFRALSGLESNTAQVAQVAQVPQAYTAEPTAAAPQQLTLQNQSDEVNQDKDKKGSKCFLHLKPRRMEGK